MKILKWMHTMVYLVGYYIGTDMILSPITRYGDGYTVFAGAGIVIGIGYYQIRDSNPPIDPELRRGTGDKSE